MFKILEKLLGALKLAGPKASQPGSDKISRIFKFRYTRFKDLLASNTELLNIITDLEYKLRGQEVFGMSYARSQAARAIFHALRMSKSLEDLSGHRHSQLFAVVQRINEAIGDELGKKKELPLTGWVLPYSEITKEMVDWVGGKNANLGELKNRTNLSVPEGFAITTRAYEYFLEQNQLTEEINMLRRDLLVDSSDPAAIQKVSESIIRLIVSSPLPKDLAEAMDDAYEDMAGRISPGGEVRPKVAMRSSAIGEDSELSFAGQYLSVLNVPPESIGEKYKEVIASLYTPRAVSYRLNKGMRDEDIAMSVACIEMAPSVASGVMYSRQPYNLSQDAVLINAVWGLGPYAVDGVITPDTYVVAKNETYDVIETVISKKQVKLCVLPEGGLVEEPVQADLQDVPCLSLEEITKLAQAAVKLEEHYKYPQDIEWAVHPDGRLLVLQTRPLHLEEVKKDGEKSFQRLEQYQMFMEGGAVAFPGVGWGHVFHVSGDEDLVNFPEGAVLVARHSTPQFVLVMRQAQAILTEAGSVTGHMAALAREFGVPTLLNMKGAMDILQPGQEITVDAYSGRIYGGKVPELIALQRTRESAMKGTPVYETLRKVADLIAPLNLVDPRANNFKAEYCKTIHDVMRLAHELSYKEMFQISDMLSDSGGGNSVKLVGPIPLDLYVIDLGGGLSGVTSYTRRVTMDQVISIPFGFLLSGMAHVVKNSSGPRPVDLGGFFSVMREQLMAPNNFAERFGDKSYAIISDKYLNFSSRIGYHYSVLDSVLWRYGQQKLYLVFIQGWGC